jgi:SAM-dependent methyltransferase
MSLDRQKEKLDQPIKRPTRVWDKDEGKLAVERNEEGRIVYKEFAERWLDDVWRIPQRPVVVPKALEYQGYPTQKPEKLLDLIVRSGSKPGDLVADFFCGSGTTLAVAEKLGRRWIGVDLSKWAIQVSRKRLLQIEGCKPFEIFNLGNYERHKLAANGHWERYVQFILELYRAEPVTGFTTLHGKKARAYVHVGSVDSPVTMREIRQTLKEAQSAGVREVHFLGWDFEMGLHDLVSQVGDDYGVKVRLVSIPREALEVTNPAKEEVRFFDLNYLELEHEVNPKNKKVTVRLKDFIIANPEYIPEEVRQKITKFTDYIDYWAVDWDYRDDTFHNGWQSFRTRKDPKLATEATHTYEKRGSYKILVKVVDIFGNDTTKMVEVEV